MSDHPSTIHYTRRDGPTSTEAKNRLDAVQILRTLMFAGIEDARVGDTEEDAMPAAVWLVAVAGLKS